MQALGDWSDMKSGLEDNFHEFQNKQAGVQASEDQGDFTLSEFTALLDACASHSLGPDQRQLQQEVRPYLQLLLYQRLEHANLQAIEAQGRSTEVIHLSSISIK